MSLRELLCTELLLVSVPIAFYVWMVVLAGARAIEFDKQHPNPNWYRDFAIWHNERYPEEKPLRVSRRPAKTMTEQVALIRGLFWRYLVPFDATLMIWLLVVWLFWPGLALHIL